MTRILLAVREIVPEMALHVIGLFGTVAVRRLEGCELANVLTDLRVQIPIGAAQALDVEAARHFIREDIDARTVLLHSAVDVVEQPPVVRLQIVAAFVGADAGHDYVVLRESPPRDVVAIQDEITGAIAAAIEPQIHAAESFRAHRKPPASLDAWDLLMRAQFPTPR